MCPAGVFVQRFLGLEFVVEFSKKNFTNLLPFVFGFRHVFHFDYDLALPVGLRAHLSLWYQRISLQLSKTGIVVYEMAMLQLHVETIRTALAPFSGLLLTAGEFHWRLRRTFQSGRGYGLRLQWALCNDERSCESQRIYGRSHVYSRLHESDSEAGLQRNRNHDAPAAILRPMPNAGSTTNSQQSGAEQRFGEIVRLS